ncbi:unnamed protein product, partial [Ectocarpus sp. 8 AP-2014]
MAQASPVCLDRKIPAEPMKPHEHRRTPLVWKGRGVWYRPTLLQAPSSKRSASNTFWSGGKHEVLRLVYIVLLVFEVCVSAALVCVSGRPHSSSHPSLMQTLSG